jgi:hypothetical protein
MPVVPYKGPTDELFFDQAKHPTANQALIEFRNRIQDVISDASAGLGSNWAVAEKY